MARRFLLVCLMMVFLGLGAAPSHAAGPDGNTASVIAPPLLGFGLDGAYLTDPTTFTQAKNTGTRWIRMGIYWANLEPTDQLPANYDWTSSDLDLNPVISAGLIPVVMVMRTPGWAGPNRCGPIDTTNAGKLADFAEFMGALATRYPQVGVWGLYNEVDGTTDVAGVDGCFGNVVTGDLNGNGVADTADYAEMLATARKAVRQADTNAEIAISVALDNFDTVSCPTGYPGGCPNVIGANYNFLPNLFAYMAAHPRPAGEAYADLVGFNYFDIYGYYWETRTGANYHGIQAKAQFVRGLMQSAGVSFQLYVGETGEDSGVPSVGLDGQSQCLVTEMVRGAAAGMEGISWWMVKDVPANNWYYGLVDVSLNPKPAHKAYQVLVEQLTQSVFEKSLSTKKAEAYQFAQGKNKTAVLWSSVVASPSFVPCANTHKKGKFLFSKVKKLTVVDMYHNTKTVVRDNGTGDLDSRVKFIKIQLGSAPMYVKYKQ